MFDSLKESVYLLPLIIFCCRICDVSIGTVRVIFVSRGYKKLSAFLGFLEVLIWIIVISQIMQNMKNVFCYFAYAGGFATGNVVGIWIEHKLSIGKVIVRIITEKDATDLINFLRDAEFHSTILDGKHSDGTKVSIIFMTIRRADLRKVREIIRRFNPNAFYSVEDVRFVNEKMDDKTNARSSKQYFLDILRPLRNRK